MIINEAINNKKLKEYQVKNNELNISIAKIRDDVIYFFGKELKKNISDLLKFFNSKIITNNYKKVISEKNKITEDKIVINEINYDDSKIHLFTPQFLLINGLKTKYQEEDFEIFNEDVYSVDLFTKFINKIIDAFNDYIGNNKQKDFIIKHQVNFHKKNLDNYMSAIIDFDDKNELKNFNVHNMNDSNNFIKIKIYKKNEENDTKNNINELLNQNENKINKSNESSSKSKVTSKNSISDTIKYQSDEFENLINNKLKENSKNNNLIALPNISFKLNLIIPKYNNQSNSINFTSVHLDYCDMENENNCINDNEKSKNDTDEKSKNDTDEKNKNDTNEKNKNDTNEKSKNTIDNLEENKNAINYSGFKEIDSVFKK